MIDRALALALAVPVVLCAATAAYVSTIVIGAADVARLVAGRG